MTVALVTGGNRGLGLATVRALAQEGVCVILAARDPAAAQQEAARLRAEGLDVRGIGLDVTSKDDVDRAVDAVAADPGRLDVLVNNAGILPEASAVGEHDFGAPGMFEATFDVNVFGVVAVTEGFLPLLRRSAAGRIVNVSTTMGSLSDQSDPDSPYYGMVVPAYQASKAALNSITIGLAKTLAGTPVKVTSVCPGFVRTDLTPVNRNQAPLSAEQASQTVVDAAMLSEDSPSGRFVDRAGAVAW